MLSIINQKRRKKLNVNNEDDLKKIIRQYNIYSYEKSKNLLYFLFPIQNEYKIINYEKFVKEREKMNENETNIENI